MCEMQYFSEYILGWKDEAGKAAAKGTIVHKVLEILAKLKLAKQESNLSDVHFQEDSPAFIKDDICGEIWYHSFDLHDICEKVFGYYSKHLNQNWVDSDFKDCCHWVNTVIDFNNGAFNPLNLNIISPEQQFDIEIKQPWALYNYAGVEGYFKLKGTIDLIVESAPGIYEIIDWKTGRRLNWATGEEKTHEKLMDDPQLRMYHYAVHALYPKIEQVVVSIFFIRDGGPFTLCYSKDDLPHTENIIREKYEYIKNTKTPKCTRSWRCKKFCGQGLHTFQDTNIKSMTEFRSGQIANKGEIMTRCDQLNLELTKKGVDKVIEQYTKPGHTIDFYQNPGE